MLFSIHNSAHMNKGNRGYVKNIFIRIDKPESISLAYVLCKTGSDLIVIVA